MTETGDIESRLRQLLAKELALPEDRIQTSWKVSDLGLDSLAFLEMVVAVEQDLGIHIDVDRLPPAIPPEATLQEMVGFVVAALDGGTRFPTAR